MGHVLHINSRCQLHKNKTKNRWTYFWKPDIIQMLCQELSLNYTSFHFQTLIKTHLLNIDMYYKYYEVKRIKKGTKTVVSHIFIVCCNEAASQIHKKAPPFCYGALQIWMFGRIHTKQRHWTGTRSRRFNSAEGSWTNKAAGSVQPLFNQHMLVSNRLLGCAGTLCIFNLQND